MKAARIPLKGQTTMITKLANSSSRHKARAPLQQPTLFQHDEDRRIRALPLPARRIARQYGFASARALLTALAAGFACEDDK
jgi:hypothetical protein